MRRKPRPTRPDPRSAWMVAQGARCGCRGADDMCACQNAEEPWKYGLGGKPPPTREDMLAEALYAIRNQLEAAKSSLMFNNRWVNEAGYITDAALWIERAIATATYELEEAPAASSAGRPIANADAELGPRNTSSLPLPQPPRSDR